MSRLTIVFASLLFIGACATSDDSETPNKNDARAQVGKSDVRVDFCELYDWYDDGECDDFCLNRDPDCEVVATCLSDDSCGDGERCNAADVCLSPCAAGEICPAVCAGFCVEAPEPDTCEGAWTDQFGTCRTPADGVYPDECCAGATCGGFANLACPDEEWCSFGGDVPDGSADLSGVCRTRPQFCAEIFAPVCGRDGNTYGNECDAHSAGVDVDHDGECSPAICGGFANLPCASDAQWCSFPTNVPDGSADLSGTCQTRPQFCTQEFAPVCGRDRNTYSNSCHANAAGVDAVTDGPCEV